VARIKGLRHDREDIELLKARESGRLCSIIIPATIARWVVAVKFFSSPQLSLVPGS
jgi:hypothetical protein